MAIGTNKSDDIASYVHTIFEAATLAARDRNFMTGLVSTWFDERGTATRSRSEYGTVGYNQITDTDDLVSQTFTPSVQNSLSPYLYAAQFLISDRRLRADPFQLQGDASRELGEGAGKQVNLHLTGLFSSLTGGTVGTAGGTVTTGNLFAAIAKLKQQNAPPPYFGVLQEGHWYHIGTVLIPAGGVSMTNAPELQEVVSSRYYAGYAMGVYWFTTNDITSGTAAVGAVFSREALGFDERKAFGIEYQRDASKGGGSWELNATMDYAYGVWRPNFGCQVVATSVVP